MDGYAVRAADTEVPPVKLALVGRVAAGSPQARPLEQGEAMAISTGGVVPAGADAVVPLELAEEHDGHVELLSATRPGSSVREAGGDVASGAVVLESGALIGAAQVGALAAAGISELRCTKRPRVGIIVTGSELRPPGKPLGAGEIYESNGVMLAGLLVSAGAVPAQLGIVGDDVDEHRKAMEKALLGFDMLVTTGGASVGPHDLVRRVQAELRVEEVFWGVAVKPGRPVSFAMRRDHPVFNLPGNPVSALVCFELFIRPAINVLLGIPDPLPRYARGVLADSVRGNPQRDQLLRARAEYDGETVRLHPLGGQESHQIVSAARGDTLVRVPRGEAGLEAGAEVRYLPLP
jgi:molybdopterin molybdotransferase